MSHVVQIQTEVRDAESAHRACRRLGLDAPVEGEVKLFRETVSGLAVNLPRWKYPVVFQLATGQSKFDNYQGHWGDRAELEKFLQAYAVERTMLEARRKGYSASEQPLENGAIKVTVQVGDTASLEREGGFS